MYFYIFPSVCLFVFLCRTLFMSVCLYGCLYGCLYVGMSACLPADMSVCLPVLSYCRSIYLSIHSSTRLSCCLSIVNKYCKQAVISRIEKKIAKTRICESLLWGFFVHVFYFWSRSRPRSRFIFSWKTIDHLWHSLRKVPKFRGFLCTFAPETFSFSRSIPTNSTGKITKQTFNIYLLKLGPHFKNFLLAGGALAGACGGLYSIECPRIGRKKTIS